MVQRLIVGSHALVHNGLRLREPKDFDVFAPPGVYANGDRFWHESFSDWIPEGTYRYATMDELYTIKASHQGWELKNGSWNKHRHDLVMMKRAGAKIDDSLYKLLYKVWEGLHGKKVMNLDQEAADFFSDAVRRVYDHDSLHYSVAYGDRPMYEEVLKDGQEINMDMAKIKSMPHEWIVNLFREEVYATALERIVIPRNYRVSAGYAYQWALRRTVTSLTKGWSSRFIIDNIEEFTHPDDYVGRHLSKRHLLIPLEG